MASEKHEELEDNIKRAVFQEALFRSEGAVVIAIAVIGTVLAATGLMPDALQFIPAWAWLAGGAVAEGAILFSAINDENFAAQVTAKLLERKFEPGRIRDKRLRQGFNQAIEYRKRIEEAIRTRDDSMLKDELSQTAGQIDDWLENMSDLALRIDRYEKDKHILERDRQRNQSRIQQLRQQMAFEQNPAVRAQIEATLNSMEQQQKTIRTLDDTIKRARLQFEHSLVHLGTIYSQTILFDAKDIDSGRARRLRQEIADEVIELNDTLLALDEVQALE